MQAPVEPIFSFVGLLEGVNVHDPFLDHVLRPGEFDEATADKFFVTPTIIDDTFHVTVVATAADTGPSAKPPNNINPTSSNTLVRLIPLL